MIINAENIVNPITLPQSQITVRAHSEYIGIGKDLETISRQYDDIYKHYFFPVTRQRVQFSDNWVKQAQSLFEGIRAFTEEEAEIHKQGLMRLFKSTGRNRHKK
jgi:hypothetical protein